MKTRILALLLALIGVSGCAKKPCRSKALRGEGSVRTDVIEPVRLMYGVPYRTYDVQKVAPQHDSVRK